MLVGLGTGLLLSLARAAGQRVGPSLAPRPAPGPEPANRALAWAPRQDAAALSDRFSQPGAAAPEVVAPQRLAAAIGQPALYELPRGGPPDWAALDRLLAHTADVPLLARSDRGKLLLAYGARDEAASGPSARALLGVTNTERDDDQVSLLTREAFATDVRTVATQGGALGLQLQAAHTVPDWGIGRWDVLYFAGLVRNWANATTMMALRRPDGATIELPAGQVNYVLDAPYEDLWRAASGQNASALVPSFEVPADSPTLSFPYLTNEKAMAWLGAQRGPVLGYSQLGLPYFLCVRDNTTVRLVATAGWGGAHDIGREFSADRFHFLDGLQQRGSPSFTARHDGATVSAGRPYALADVTCDDTVRVRLTDARAHSVTLALDDFRQHFGADAVHALVVSLRTPPQLTQQQRADGVTYQPLPAAARWFDDAPTPGLVPVDTANWTAAAVLACQLQRNPAYVRQMIRRSWDNDPHHVDVRFCSPDADVDPHIVTIDDRLPTRAAAAPNRASDPVGVSLILKALATFLDEHLSAPLGPAGSGYDALATLVSGPAFDTIVGRTGGEFTLAFAHSERGLRWLHGNYSAGNLVTLTMLPSNLPGPTMDLLPSLLERRTYAVLGVADDAANQTRLRLGGPWADGISGAAGEPRWVPWNDLQGVAERVTWAAPGISL